ncbi:MAG: hypothetical protein Kow0026_26270 [Oricola sp.]
MKKTLLAAVAAVLSATAVAQADSSILDVYEQPVVKHDIDYTATAAIGGEHMLANPRLGDGAPVADLTARPTLSAGQAVAALVGARLGDGAPE